MSLVQDAYEYSRNLGSSQNVKGSLGMLVTYRLRSLLVSPPCNTGMTDTRPKLRGRLDWIIQCPVPHNQGSCSLILSLVKNLCPSTFCPEISVTSCSRFLPVVIPPLPVRDFCLSFALWVTCALSCSRFLSVVVPPLPAEVCVSPCLVGYLPGGLRAPRSVCPTGVVVAQV